MDQQKRTIFLVHNTARENAARMCHQAPGDWVAVFKPKTRSLEQNAKLHAMLTDISDQAIYMGKKRSVEFWKGLFVSGYQIATGKSPEIVPGLEGEFINIRLSTASMGIRMVAELIEYISAWAAMNEVRFKDDRAVY